jgi:hypothetical protein
MGIYYRYAAAALILLFCADTYAVTRKTVNHGQSNESVIKGSGASFQTPNGEAGYYGRDYVDEHTAGNRFTTNDSPGASAKQKVTVKPTLRVDPKKAAKSMIGGLRGGVPGVVASAAAAAIVDAVGGIIDDAQIKFPEEQEVGGTQPGNYYWTVPFPDLKAQYSSAVAACAANHAYYADRNSSSYAAIEHEIIKNSDTNFTCETYGLNHNPYTGQLERYGRWNNPATRVGSNCPDGATYNPNTGQCLIIALVPPDDSHWSAMEDWAAARDSDFTRDIVRASCEGSNAPARCYEEMSNWGNLQGPASQTGTPQVTTSTTKNPDGTTSTTTTTVENRYEYNYGPDYYNYTTTTTITQNKDGVITETVTSDGMPTDNPTQEEDSTDYTFNDTEFPEVPSFYEQKYPDGLSGVWHQASADVDQSAFMQFLQGFVPSFSGSCPAFGLGFNIASWANYGTVQFLSICYVLDFVKIILLVTALFTFRKVTFGG